MKLDLGHDHTAEVFGWHPDRQLNPQYAHLDDVDAWGVQVAHRRADDPSRKCASFATFDGPAQRETAPTQPKWTLESLDPLTLSPSLLCRDCGDHGFIRDGRWVPA